MDDARAFYSTLPIHDGDGYSWGGDAVVTIGDRSFVLGGSKQSHELAKEIARRWNARSLIAKEPTDGK